MKGLNITAYIGIFVTSLTMLFAVPSTSFAYFSDPAETEDNEFVAGTLVVAVDPVDEDVVLMESGDVTASFDISDSGSIASQYEVTVVPTACSGAFMDGVDVEVSNGEVLYQGSLSDMVATSTSSGVWDFTLSASSTLRAYENDACEVELTVRAGQYQFTNWNQGGFTDEATTTLTITAGQDINLGVVLNEILPNPEGDDAQGGLQGEWIEVYNTGSTPVDLTGWYIKDVAGNIVTFSPSTTLNGQVIADIPGSGNEWVVLFMSGAILNNTGDTVELYNAADELQDSYSYLDNTNENDADSDSNHTGGAGNGNPAGSETEHQEGKSDARIPDGFGEWIDPEPTAGEPNEVTEEELVALGYSESMIEFLLLQQARARERFEAQQALLIVEQAALQQVNEEKKEINETPEIPFEEQTAPNSSESKEPIGNREEETELVDDEVAPPSNVEDTMEEDLSETNDGLPQQDSVPKPKLEVKELESEPAVEPKPAALEDTESITEPTV